MNQFSPFQELYCAEPPPPAPEGEGSERAFGFEITKYRCKNGYQWKNGQWPYLEMECLNRKWSPKLLPECVRKYQCTLTKAINTFLARSCGLSSPIALMGMDVDWPYKSRTLGDKIVFHCPSNSLTWEEHLETQTATCIWHR